jgi:CRP-like cAMP-binding protein
MPGGHADRDMSGASVQALRGVPLFAEFDERELEDVASVFKERTFSAGETIIQQGSGASAFYVIESGEAKVFVDGAEQRALGPGDHLGEMALIDAGTRTATVTAASDVVCSGVTFWDFRPLVERNGAIAWKLLESLIGIYRSEREAQSQPGGR